VQSVGQLFEQFKNLVSARLNEQAARLQVQAQQASKSLGASSAVPALQQGTKSVAQLKDVVKAMSNKLGSKVDAHEFQLIQANKARKYSLQANVTQLNELTKSVAQLKDVVKAMSNKLGSKVDAHESQIIEVEQALKKLRKPARSKKSR
jgi:benzoyl-CoA reductase/2-hydroxyglutaryl-CoA dehydratase subunit BcrC/BadD/HgdB